MTETQRNNRILAATRAMEAGKLQEAHSLCDEVLRDSPRHAEAFFQMGWCEHKLKQSDSAIQRFREAVAQKPSEARFRNGLAVALMGKQQWTEALEPLRKAIELQPGYGEAHGNLGKCLWKVGQIDEATAAYRAAAELSPNVAEVHNNLGNFLRETHRAEQAVAAHLRAVQLRSDIPVIFLNLGLDYSKLGKPTEAVAAYEQVLKLKPDHTQAKVCLAAELTCVKRWDDALRYAQEVLDKYPDHPAMRLVRGLTLEVRGDRAGAVAEMEGILRLYPNYVEAQYYLANFTGAAAPAPTADHPMVKLWDFGAATFDETLVNKLQYRTPELLMDALRPLLPSRPVDVMDVGCGTGLVGRLLKPVAGKLIGVDLSAGMLEQAAKRKVYDELIQAEGAAALNERPGMFELVIAADVFVYIGVLDGIFEAAAKSLKRGGLFAFSTEAKEGEGGEGFHLLPTARYAHSRSYLSQMATAHGFRELHIDKQVIRKDAGADIWGYIVVLKNRDE